MSAPFGTYYKRREPKDDAGDVVTVTGAVTVHVDEVRTDALVIQSAEFGAVPPGWDEHTALFTLKDFTDEYAPMDNEARTVLALEQATAAKAETEALQTDPDRISPWAYVARNERRTKARTR